MPEKYGVLADLYRSLILERVRKFMSETGDEGHTLLHIIALPHYSKLLVEQAEQDYQREKGFLLQKGLVSVLEDIFGIFLDIPEINTLTIDEQLFLLDVVGEVTTGEWEKIELEKHYGAG